jgi:hypothetical protein
MSLYEYLQYAFRVSPIFTFGFGVAITTVVWVLGLLCWKQFFDEKGEKK